MTTPKSQLETQLIEKPRVRGLDAFADGFLARCTRGETIIRYMVLVASEQKLLMMRQLFPSPKGAA